MTSQELPKINLTKDLFLFAFILLSMTPLRFIFDEKTDSVFGLIALGFGILYIAFNQYRIFPYLNKLKVLFLFYFFVITVSMTYFIVGDIERNGFNEIFRLTYIVALIIVLSMMRYDKFIVSYLDRIFLFLGLSLIVFTLIYNSIVQNIDFIDIINRIGGLTYIQNKFKYKGLGSGTIFAFISLLLFLVAFLNVLTEKNKIIYIIIMSVAGLFLISTIQRGILIQLVLSILILIKLHRYNLSKKLVYFILTILILGFSLFQFWEDYYYRFFVEPEISTDLFLSGRMSSMQFAIDRIGNFDIFDILLGEGTNRINLVLEENSMEMLHNDYLMIFYNYGLFGFITWVGFLLSLMIMSLQYRKRTYDDKIKKISTISAIFIFNLLLASLHTNMIHEYKFFVFLMIPFLITSSTFLDKKRLSNHCLNMNKL